MRATELRAGEWFGVKSARIYFHSEEKLFAHWTQHFPIVRVACRLIDSPVVPICFSKET